VRFDRRAFWPPWLGGAFAAAAPAALVAVAARMGAIADEQLFAALGLASLSSAPQLGVCLAVVFYLLSVCSVALLCRGTQALVGFPLKVLSILLFSLLVLLPFTPDLTAAFSSGMVERSWFVVLSSVALVWFALAVCTLPLRVGAVFLVCATNRSKIWTSLVAFILPILELSMLYVFPLAHFGALVPPIPKATMVPGVDAQHWPARAGAPESTPHADSRIDIVVSSDWGEEQRSMPLSTDGGLSNWDDLIERASQQLSLSKSKTARLYFPETFFGENSPDVRLVFERLARDRDVDFVAGVGNSSSNQIAWVGRDPLTGKVIVRQVAKKQRLVPFFEGQVFGVHLWSGDARVPSFWDGLLPVSSPLFGPNKPQVLICYEAIFPLDRDSSRDAVVFGNHHLFRRWRLLSLAFDYELRLVAQLSGQKTLVVQNGGRSGWMMPLWSHDVTQVRSKGSSGETLWITRLFVLKIPSGLGL
jgi:hypothetical protein